MGDVARFAPLAGLASVALVIAGSLTIGFYTYLPAQDEIDTFFSENGLRVRWGAYVMGLAAFFMLVFAGSLWNYLRDRGGSQLWPAVAAMGAIVAAGLIIVNAALLAAAGDRGNTEAGIGGGAAVLLWDVSATIMGQGLALALGTMVGAFSIVALTARILPSWFNWVALLAAVGMLAPLNFVVFALGFVWMLVVSVVMFRTEAA